MDGVINNDGLKHNKQDEQNETWSILLKELKVYENMSEQDHLKFLRNQFVVGASSWCAGYEGSLENNKVDLGYTNRQWELIWSTMAESSAWSVPDILDEDGCVLVRNYAPELMMKYIAHHLKCNIIVFDLVLGLVQFCSGNRLKKNNVVFDSPLLLYSTGSHFQSVIPIDQEFFINFARQKDQECAPATCYTPMLESCNVQVENDIKICIVNVIWF